VTIEPLVAVIDDDDPFRAALVESLCSFGYRVRDFASAEQFIAANVEPLCDCIITDIHMPGMSGLDLKRHLAVRGCKAPVIMITARAEEGLEASVAASGAVCLLRKPFESDDLIGWLNRVLKY
jgi:FixJ family two-component response regulator